MVGALFGVVAVGVTAGEVSSSESDTGSKSTVPPTLSSDFDGLRAEFDIAVDDTVLSLVAEMLVGQNA